jgi:type I restriction enzyme, S subunit
MATLKEAAGTRGLFTDGDWILSDNMSEDGTIGVIQLKHVGVGDFLRKEFQFITEKIFKELGCTEVLPGDVLISRMADPLARACIVPPLPFRVVTAVDVTILRVDESLADKRFVMQMCNSPLVQERAQKAARGTTRSRITRTELGEIEVPLPPLRVQRDIANRLEQAARLRRMRRHVLQMCDEFLPAAFIELFGDPLNNDHHFDLVQLEDELECIESGFSPVCQGARTSTSQWAVLGLGAVTTGIFKPEDNKRVPDTVSPRIELEVRDGDLLVTRKNTSDLVAACVYVRNPPPRLLLPDTIFRFRLKKDSQLSPVFLWALFTYPSFRKSVQRLAAGSAGSMPGISKEKFMTIRCPVPPASRQNDFAEIALRHERLRTTHVEALRQADHLFQALLHQAFSS